MWKKIDDYVKKYHMFALEDRILIGLSGGADSVLLAHYFLYLRRNYGLFFCAAHMNHQIRGDEASRDEDFVKDFCERWDIPLHIFRKDVPAFAKNEKCSLEEAARTIRYECLRQCAKAEHCNRIALAHHAGDQAETMLFRMIRGTGPEGLSGIRPVNDELIRPLLTVDKTEILRQLKLLGQDYVEDSSNAETDYSRNYIRHCILPKMCELNGEMVTHLSTLASQLAQQNDYLSRQFDRLYEQHITYDESGEKMALGFLLECERYEQEEMIRRMIFHAGGHRKDITAVHVKTATDLLYKSSGKRVNLPYNLTAVRQSDCLYIGVGGTVSRSEKLFCLDIPLRQLEADGEYLLKVNDKIILLFTVSSAQEMVSMKKDCKKYFDYDKIKDSLCVRNRRPGDYFIMDDSGHRKKLNRYFIDKKISSEQREEIILLAMGDHILWVVGDRISESFKVSPATQNILCVTVLN